MTCPHCGAESGLEPQTSGEAIFCRGCGARVSLAMPDAASAVIQPRRASWLAPLATLAVLAAAALVIGVVVGASILSRALDARHRREQCAERLHKLSVALRNYADEHGVYPPAVVKGPHGRPWHSWRVFILPQLGEEEDALHKEYHYDEAWDGAHNRLLADRMPDVYRCPEDPEAWDSSTSYLGIVDGANGEFAAYPSGGSNAPLKPPLTSYLVVEAAECGVCWMEPRDLTLAKDSLPDRPLPTRLSYHVGGGQAVDADGATIVLPDAELARAIFAKPAALPASKQGTGPP